MADVNTRSKFANALNVGLTTSTSVKVKKNWADKNAQKKPITVKLLADGKEAKDLDGKAVPAVTAQRGKARGPASLITSLSITRRLMKP